MKSLSLILLLVSFIQTSVVPVNLALLILIARAFIRTEKENLYLAFIFGLVLSLLSNSPLGLYSAVLILSTGLVHIAHKLPVSKNILTLIPLAVVLSFIYDNIGFFSGVSMQLTFNLVLSGLLIIPVFIFIKLLDERSAKPEDIRLKI